MKVNNSDKLKVVTGAVVVQVKVVVVVQNLCQITHLFRAQFDLQGSGILPLALYAT